MSFDLKTDNNFSYNLNNTNPIELNIPDSIKLKKADQAAQIAMFGFNSDYKNMA